MSWRDFWFFVSLAEDVYPYIIIQFALLREQMRFGFGKTMLICAAVLAAQFAGLVALSHQPFYTPDIMIVYRSCSLATLAALSVILIKGDFSRAAFVYSLMLPYMALILALGSYAVTLYGSETDYMVSAIVRFALSVITFPAAWRFGKKRLLPAMKVIDPSIWKIAWVIPCIFSLISLFSFGNDMELAGTTLKEVFMRLGMLAGVICVCFLLLNALRKSAQIATEREYRRRVESMLDMQTARFRELSERMDETRRARHDIRHHLAAFRGFADRGDLSAVSEYLKELNDSVRLDSTLMICKNETVDAVMSYYVADAKSKGIQLEVEFNIASEIALCPGDLCVILGNLMENAIEACEPLPAGKRLIIARGRAINRSLSLVFSNSFDGKVVREETAFLSRKYDFGREGVGIASVRALVEKHGGECKFEYDGGIFTSAILLPLAKA